ncbi:hypothetical protein ACFLVL_02165 [Chloroflexota bacterium]
MRTQLVQNNAFLRQRCRSRTRFNGVHGLAAPMEAALKCAANVERQLKTAIEV